MTGTVRTGRRDSGSYHLGYRVHLSLGHKIIRELMWRLVSSPRLLREHLGFVPRFVGWTVDLLLWGWKAFRIFNHLITAKITGISDLGLYCWFMVL